MTWSSRRPESVTTTDSTHQSEPIETGSSRITFRAQAFSCQKVAVSSILGLPRACAGGSEENTGDRKERFSHRYVFLSVGTL